MALKITADCNNCGACLPECPNSAIYVGPEIYMIDAERCTECVGFYSDTQCSLACPVFCCIADESHPESEEELILKVKNMYPENDYSGAVQSHYSR